MKATVLWAVLGLCSLAYAQDDSPPYREATRLIKPQISILIRPGPLGTDFLRVTALDPNYPSSLLVEQLQRLGEYAGSPTRSIQLAQNPETGETEGSTFPTASCGVSGLVDRQAGHFWLEPIAKAFAGAPEPHTVTGLHLTFEGTTPAEDALSTYANDGVAVFGSFSFLAGEDRAQVPVLEYRVALRTQDPEAISVPITLGEAKPEPPPPAPRPGLSGVFLAAVIALGALAAGALVYFVVLGIGGSKSKSPPSKR